jgi:predicted DNA-binding protein
MCQEGKMQESKKWKQFCLMLTHETLRRIDMEIQEREGITKTHWIREAIQQKFLERKESK